MLVYLTRLFLIFITFSFLGWCIEELYALFITKIKTNRGFLVGPLCPVYGFTSVFLILLLDRFKDNLIILFILSFIIAAIIEYLASYILEKIFNIKLWDYSKDSKFEIHGRIALNTLIPFGILGIVVIKFINPFFQSILDNININILYIVSIIIIILLIIDIIFSVFVIKHTKGSGDITDKKNQLVKKQIKKTTKEVKRQIKDTTSSVKQQIKNTNDTIKNKIKK